MILAHGANPSFFLFFLGLLFDFGVCWYRDTGTHKDSYIEVLLELSSLDSVSDSLQLVLVFFDFAFKICSFEPPKPLVPRDSQVE